MKRPVPLLGLVLLASCASQRRIDRDELRSDLTSGISLASEACLYLRYLAEGRGARSFSEGHLHYLAGEANRTGKELREAVSAPEDAQTLHEARLQFAALSEQLAQIGQESSDAKARILCMRQLKEIGKAMEEAKGTQ
jgi:hypothetical protein